MDVQTVKTICLFRPPLEWSVGVVGIIGAGFWFVAAFKSGRTIFMETPMNQFDLIAREQAKFNSVAAALTGIASLVQVILFYMPSCRDFG
jgi:hypothetical protein